MPAPIIRQLLSDTSRPARAIRHIDNHYHLEMVAENSRQLIEYQEQSFRLQQEAAIANIRAMGEIAHRQDESNSLLSTLVYGTDRLADSVDAFHATARETLGALNAQTQVLQEGFEDIAAALQEGFEDIAERMMQQQRVLHEIADILRRPYETKALELLKEGENALQNGMKASGRDREEDFKDAMRLLRDVLDNPIGSRNYVAWFQTGWLKWKYTKNFAEAEEAFYQAARLSGTKTDFFHNYSLYHLAYMQDLQGRPAEAYDTIHKALRVTPNNHDTMYDAARYAAKTARESEALELLNRCIDLQPHTIDTMFSEEDFMSATMQQKIASLSIRRTEAGRAKALGCIEAWQHAITDVRQAESMAECRINLPNEQIQGVQQATREVETANYVLAVYLANKATAKREAVLATAVEALQEEIKHCAEVLQEEIKHCDKEQSDATHTIQSAIRECDNAVNMAKRNHSSIVEDIPYKAYCSADKLFGYAGSIMNVPFWLSVAISWIFLEIGDVMVDNLFFRLVLIFFLFGPFMFSLLFICQYTVTPLYKKREILSRTAVADATLQKAVQAAEMRLREQRVVIEKRLREQKVVFEKRISQAEAHKKKVENALQWLKAEFVQHDEIHYP